MQSDGQMVYNHLLKTGSKLFGFFPAKCMCVPVKIDDTIGLVWTAKNYWHLDRIQTTTNFKL